MGYEYESLLREFLGYIRKVFGEFSRIAEKHYEHENIKAVGLPSFVEEKLYEFVQHLYLSYRKYSRSCQALYIYDGVSDSLGKLLASVDVYIAMLDEFYDEELSRKEKLSVLGALTVVHPYMVKAAAKLNLVDALSRYLTMPAFVALSQLRRDLDLVLWYYWRGSAMDFFMEVPARDLGVSVKEVLALVEAGRWLRGIILVWKDLHDVEHDKKTGAENPFIKDEVDLHDLVKNLVNGLNRSLERIRDAEKRKRILEVANYYLANIEKI